VRVVLAEDFTLLRQGVAQLLTRAGFEVVGETADSEELLSLVEAERPDLVITDIRLPPTQTTEGIRAAAAIRERFPETAVLVLSHHIEPEYALNLIGDGVERFGYLLKDRVGDAREFVAAVQRVADGGSVVDPAIVSDLIRRSRHDEPIDTLTPREREVLELMAEGRSNRAIAERMVVTDRAVEKHVNSIFGKLHLPPAPDDHRRVLAVLAFLHG
jgi:DNA-binding NarL/FixJ family response regulator